MVELYNCCFESFWRGQIANYHEWWTSLSSGRLPQYLLYQFVVYRDPGQPSLFWSPCCSLCNTGGASSLKKRPSMAGRFVVLICVDTSLAWTLTAWYTRAECLKTCLWFLSILFWATVHSLVGNNLAWLHVAGRVDEHLFRPCFLTQLKSDTLAKFGLLHLA